MLRPPQPYAHLRSQSKGSVDSVGKQGGKLKKLHLFVMFVSSTTEVLADTAVLYELRLTWIGSRPVQ